jgi:DNA mismatch endonuclease (patch repair protein)
MPRAPFIVRGIVEGTRRTADVVFPAARVAVFLDGCFWHGCPLHGTSPKNNAAWWRAKIDANIVRDRDTDARLMALSWTVVRIWEHEDFAEASDRIEAIVRRATHSARMRP